MRFEKGRKLRDIKLREVSFVKNPANRRTFLFFKSAGVEHQNAGVEHQDAGVEHQNAGGEHETNEELEKERTTMDKELKELLEEFLGEEIDDEKDIEKAGKLSEKAVNAIKGALKILNKYKDALPDDAKAAVDTLAKYATSGYPYPKPYKKNDEESDLEKAGRKLSKATMEKLLAIRKLIDELLPDDVKKMAEEVDKDEQAFEMLQDMHDKLFAEPDEDNEDKEDDQDDKETGEVMKTLKQIDSRLEKLEKMKGKKRELDDEEDEEDDEDGDPFPTIKLE